MALGRSAGRGLIYLVIGSGSTKLLSFIAQIALGFLLTQDDFGTFGLAISAAAVVQAIQNGGITLFLSSQTADTFEEHAPASFWLAMISNVVVAALIVAMAYPVGHIIYDDPNVTNVLYVLAGAALLGAPRVVLMAKLNIDLRQDALSKARILAAFGRYSSCVLLAWHGFGAMSFAIALAIATVVETVVCQMACPLPFHRYPFRLRALIELLKRTRWLIFSSLVGGLQARGEYLMAGLFVATGIVGVYFFAWQFIAQIGVLVGVNARMVLTPILTRMNDEPERQRDALMRSMRGMMLLLPFAGIGLGIAFPALQHLVWENRWADAVHPALLLSVSDAFRTLLVVISSALMARHMFRTYSLMLLMMAITIMTATAMGAWLGGTAMWIAAGSASSAFVCTPFILFIALRHYDIPLRTVLGNMFVPPLYAIVAAAGAIGISVLVQGQSFVLVPARDVVDKTAALIELAVIGVAYSLLFGLLVRLMCRSTVDEMCNAIPIRLSRPVRRVLRLPAPA